MLELSIPQPGEESKQAKDLVFSILAREQPLSFIELTNRIQKGHNVGITYQAVRKAVAGLHGQGVLLKEGKRYRISKEWILRLKGFFDELLATYETGTRVHGFTQEMMKEDYAVYTFNNLLDLDNFWGDVMRHWTDGLKKEDNPVFFSYYNYGFYFLINLGRETRLHEHMNSKGVRSFMLVLRDFPLNTWGLRLYKEIGVDARMHRDHDMDDSTDLNLLGDTVLQVKYPENIRRKLRRLYEKYRSVQEMSLKEVAEIAHEPGEIKLALFRNPMIAKDIREKYLPLFDR